MAKSNKHSDKNKGGLNKTPRGSVGPDADLNAQIQEGNTNLVTKVHESEESMTEGNDNASVLHQLRYGDYDNYNEVASEDLGYNAWQRLLIKIGGIKVWQPFDRKVADAASDKIEKLENHNASLATNHEEMLRKTLLILDPSYANVEVEANMLEDKVGAAIDKMRRQLKDQEDQFSLKEKECYYIKESLKAKESDFNRRETELKSTLLSKDTEIRTLKEQHDRELKTRTAGASQINNQVQKLTVMLQAKEKDVDNLNGQLTKSKAEIFSRDSKIAEMASEYQKLRESYDNLKDLLLKANEAIRRIEKENKELKDTEAGEYHTQLQEALAQKESLKSIISEKDRSIARKESEIERQSIAYKELEVQHGISQEENKNLFSQLSEERKSLKEIQRTLSERDNEIARQKGAIERKEKEVGSLKESIARRDAEISDLKTNLKTLSGQLLQAKADISKKVELIEDKDKSIDSLNSRIKADEDIIAGLQASLAGIESIARKSVHDFYEGFTQEAKAVIDVLKDGKYELGEGEMGETCADDEDMNLRKFEKLTERIASVSPEAYKTVGDLREALLEILAEEVSKEGAGIIAPLARLCAYGRMPFMREPQGEDYMSFDYKRLTQLEYHLKNMLGHVGIQLIIPTPFCDVLKDGDYEYQAGEIPNLDYICPNVRQHLDKVDRMDSDGIVTDIVCVGYRIPGKSNVKAKVLI